MQISLRATSIQRPSGNAERRVSKIEEAWAEALLRSPSGDVPMWGQMEETDDCCGFVTAKQEVPSLRVAWHGSYQVNRVQMQIKSKDQSTH